MKLCLGTVQFGLKYGISGNEKPNLNNCIEMLDYAYMNGVNAFDTASAYGTAEEILGEFIRKKRINKNSIEIISKISPDLFKEENRKNWYGEAKEAITESLKRLKIDYLDGYMLHNASKVNDEEVVYILSKLKEEGLVKSIGASIYTPMEAKRTVSYRDFEIIQIPYNIFDRRLDKDEFFQNKTINGKKIYSRSAFLQGLLLMQIDDVPRYLSKAVPLIMKFIELCELYNITREVVAISFVKSNKNIDSLVFGVDNLEQLKIFIQEFNTDMDESIMKEISKEFLQVDDYIVMPYLWNKN